jgi:hypothetical protein
LVVRVRNQHAGKCEDLRKGKQENICREKIYREMGTRKNPRIK